MSEKKPSHLDALREQSPTEIARAGHFIEQELETLFSSDTIRTVGLLKDLKFIDLVRMIDTEYGQRREANLEYSEIDIFEMVKTKLERVRVAIEGTQKIFAKRFETMGINVVQIRVIISDLIRQIIEQIHHLRDLKHYDAHPGDYSRDS